MPQSNIVLVGPMGAGKSTIGRLLAARLGYAFVDTDSVIEDRTGADIAWIFDVEGESGFRDREAQILSEVVTLPHTVVATGGGIIQREENRILLSNHPAVVYLKVGVHQLVVRTAKDKKRPLLQVDNPEAKIVALLEEREPHYLNVASHVVQAEGHSPRTTVQAIDQLFH